MQEKGAEGASRGGDRVDVKGKEKRWIAEKQLLQDAQSAPSSDALEAAGVDAFDHTYLEIAGRGDGL